MCEENLKLIREDGHRWKITSYMQGERRVEKKAGHRRKERAIEWWNVAVQQAVQDKKVVYKTWQRTRKEEDRSVYQEKKRQAKREVARARGEGRETGITEQKKRKVYSRANEKGEKGIKE